MSEFSTPSSQSVEQFSVPVQKLSIEQPAINGMADAFQRGILNFTDLLKAGSVPGEQKAKQAEDKLRQEKAQAESGMLPEAVAADKEALALKIKKIQSDLSDLAIKAQVQPTHDATVRSQADAAKIAAEEQAKVAKQIEITRALEEQTGNYGMTDRTKRYLAANGELPYSAENSEAIDYKKVDAWAAANQPNNLSPKITEAIYDKAIKAGTPIFNDQGALVHPSVLEKQIQTDHPTLDADGVKEATSMISQMTDAVQGLGDMGNIVNGKLEVVGPEWNKGSWFAQKYNQVGALLGSKVSAEKWTAQERLRMGLAQNIQATIKSLAGSGNRVMKAEIEPSAPGKPPGLFFQAMPEINSTPAQWNAWLTPRINLFSRAYEESRNSLPTGLKEKYAPAVPVAPNPAEVQSLRPSPASAITPQEKARAVLVSSQAEANSQAPGTIMVDPKGNYRRK